MEGKGLLERVEGYSGRNKENGQPRVRGGHTPRLYTLSTTATHEQCSKTWAPPLQFCRQTKVFVLRTEVSAHTVWALGVCLEPCWCFQLGGVSRDPPQ